MRPVLFITYYWPPSGGAGVQRGLKFVKYLPEFGIRPTVLTVDPASASYPLLDPSLQADVSPEVRVVRTGSFEPLRMLAAVAGKEAVPHSGFAGSPRKGPLGSAMRWVRGNLMIPDARRGWVKHAVRAASELIRSEGIGTIVITSPPHSSQLIGLRLKRLFPELRWVADLRDPWTDIYYTKDLMKGAWARRRDAAFEAAVLRSADAVVVTSPSTKALFAGRYGDDVAQRTSVIPNGYDRADIEHLPEAAPPTDRYRITYVGTMAGSYGPQIFFNAITQLRSTAAVPLEVRFVGNVSGEVRDMAVQAGVDQLCTWVPSVPHAEALREMAAANMLVIVIPDVEGAERIVPGKLFEYLAIGRPILGIGPAGGDVGAILSSTGAGRMFDRSDPSALATWLDERIRNPGPALDPAVAAQYERRALTGQLARVIDPARG